MNLRHSLLVVVLLAAAGGTAAWWVTNDRPQDRSLAGRGVAVFINGDAGIGKTRLVEEFTRAAEARGAETLWASAYEGEGGPAFWLWAQILTAHARSRTSAQLASATEGVLAEVATLIPEFEGSLPSGHGGGKVLKDLGRFRPFEAVARLLDLASRERPLVIVLDDLHWADEASLSLLRFVASGTRSQRLLLVGTYRAREAPDVLREACGYCARVLSFTQELHLEGLSRQDAEHFVRSAVRELPSREIVDSVHERTEGNPFFLQEVVRHAESMQSWNAPLPESVRQAVRLRLEGLDAACGEVLQVAAVIGRDFLLPVLARASGRPDVEVLALLDQAERRGVAMPQHSSPTEYRFRHMLIRETLYESLPRAEVAQAHARVGQALEALHGDDVAPPLAELAHHFAEALVVGGAEKAIRYAQQAGEQEIERLAYERSGEHYALALKCSTPIPRWTGGGGASCC